MTVRVGIDYDEPIFPWYDYAHDASIEHGLASPDQDPPTVWDPSSTYNCTLDDWWAVINAEIRKGEDGMYGRPIKPGVAAQLRRLTMRGYEVHVVTARGTHPGNPHNDAIKELTRRQVYAELPFVTSLAFAHNKEQAIRDLGLQYFLDDRIDYFEQAWDANALSYLLDERWNQQLRTQNRVYSTRQYVDAIIEHQAMNSGW